MGSSSKRNGIVGGIVVGGGGGLLAALHAAGVLFVTAVHSIRSWEPEIGVGVRDASVLHANLDDFAEASSENEILKDALCSVVRDINDQKPSDESVADFVSNQLFRRVTGIPNPTEKIGQFETAIDLSTWDPPVAARYARACVF